jgi:DMSO reductase anchor subunit
MHKRADGIVVVDHDKCMGCQYCSWACPYDAPQYDSARGQMTKCDFCADNLAEGKPPACVAACPMRVLDVRDAADASLEVIPLPIASLTRPALIVKPHQAAHRAGKLGNAEEVSAPRDSEQSLVVFTVLSQAAVGVTWFLSLTKQINRGALAGLALIMLIALLASFVHLGQPRHAWRAMANLRTSWLSREVLCAALFAAALLAALTTGGSGLWLANAAGLALIVSMAQVYRLRTVPEWDHGATMASFFTTTLIVGAALHGAVTGAGPAWVFGATGLVAVRLLLGRREPHAAQLARAIAVIALLVTLVTPAGWWAVLVLVSIAETIARRQFYTKRKPRSAWRFAAPSA